MQELETTLRQHLTNEGYEVRDIEEPDPLFAIAIALLDSVAGLMVPLNDKTYGTKTEHTRNDFLIKYSELGTYEAVIETVRQHYISLEYEEGEPLEIDLIYGLKFTKKYSLAMVFIRDNPPNELYVGEDLKYVALDLGVRSN